MNDNDLDGDLDAWLDTADDMRQLLIANDDGDVDVSLLDQRKVNAMLAKRARLLDERKRIDERAQERIAPIVEWRADRVSGIDDQLAWLDRGLEAFARATLTDRRRSMPFVAGTLQLTKPGQASADVIDEGEFVAWAIDEQHPERDELLRRKVEVDKSMLKKACKLGPRDDEASDATLDVFVAVDADGVVVPGVRFTKPAVDRFTVAPPA